ncbi:predicted protein [Histoplasma mississippiense (nom. inval.)]|nr:predicted protein [Histoplasma mississippiense (nom. inval.)]EDN03404.1 predicted protein [Histoplasma mississippiense (nom. inval.)]
MNSAVASLEDKFKLEIRRPESVAWLKDQGLNAISR